jgi:xanthine dehydrogenase accessory factor
VNKVNWLTAAQQCSQRGDAYVLITIIGVSGSTPRNSGTKMLLTEQETFDTIGGGHLEYKAIAHGKKMLGKCLQTGQNSQSLAHFQLAAQLGQCCGGTASLLFECFATTHTNIMLFGAGHVGQALVSILSSLPVKVTWVDERAEQFSQCTQLSQMSNVTALVSDDPCGEISAMPANSYFIVMTHNHQLDFELCQTILKQANFRYVGLIASMTKWRRFQQRFTHKEINKELVQQIHCPIGLAAVKGKKPMEVAVSIAGELISLYQQDISLHNTHQHQYQNKGIAWCELNKILTDKPATTNSTCGVKS